MSAFDIYSNYNKDASFRSLVFGEKLPILETDLNEMQQIQNEHINDVLQSVVYSGYVGDGTISFNSGTLTITNQDFIVNGEYIKVDNLSLSIPNNSSVYLDTYIDEVTYSSVLKKYGNVQSSTILTNYLLDSRVGVETTRRKVLKYNLVLTNNNTEHNYLKIGETDLNGVFTKTVLLAGLLSEKFNTYRNKITLNSETNIFNIEIPEFDSNLDILEIYQNGMHIDLNYDYTINQYEKGRIDKVSGNWSNGTVFSILVYKIFSNDINITSGSLLENGSVSIDKLDQSTIDKIEANTIRVKSYTGTVTIPFAANIDQVNVGAYINEYDYLLDTLDVYLNRYYLAPNLYTKSGNNITLNEGNFGGLVEGDSDILDFVVYKCMSDTPLDTFSGSLISEGTVNNLAFSSLVLQNLAALNSSTGFIIQNSTNGFVKRSIIANSSKISITNGDGVSDNPSIDIAEDNLNYPLGLKQTKITTPATPATGYTKLYPKSDNKYYKLTSTGIEVCIENYLTAKSIGLIGDGIVNDATILNTWITSIGVEKVDLIFTSGTYYFNSNVIFPENVNIIIDYGATLKIANSKSITGTNTKLNCGLYSCFDLSLGGIIAGTWNVKRVYSEWFGIIGDGTTDETAKFVSCLDFANISKAILDVNKKYTILIDNIIVTSLNYLKLDIKGAIKRKNANASSSLITLDSCNNAYIKEINFDGNAYNNDADEAVAYTNAIKNKHNLKITNCTNMIIDYIYAKNTCGDVVHMTGSSLNIKIGTVIGINDTIIGRSIVCISNAGWIIIENIIGRKFGHYDMPGGLDIEPQDSNHICKYIIVNNLSFEGAGIGPLSVIQENNGTVSDILINNAIVHILATDTVINFSCIIKLSGEKIKLNKALIDGNASHSGVMVYNNATLTRPVRNIKFDVDAKNVYNGMMLAYGGSSVSNLRCKFIADVCNNFGVLMDLVNDSYLDLKINSASYLQPFIFKSYGTSDNVTITGDLSKSGDGTKGIHFDGAVSAITNWTIKDLDITGWNVNSFLYNSQNLSIPLNKINCKGLTNATSIPTTGNWIVKDKVENDTPTAGGYTGWVCITAGEPGTWKGYGLIQA